MGESSDEENSQLNQISSQFFVPASLPASPTDEAESTQDYLTAIVKKSLLDLKPQVYYVFKSLQMCLVLQAQYIINLQCVEIF